MFARDSRKIWFLIYTGGGGLASYTPSKVDLTSEGFELGVTRAVSTVPVATASSGQTENSSEVEYLRPAQDAGAWGSETTGDLLYWRYEEAGYTYIQRLKYSQLNVLFAAIELRRTKPRLIKLNRIFFPSGKLAKRNVKEKKNNSTFILKFNKKFTKNAHNCK